VRLASERFMAGTIARGEGSSERAVALKAALGGA